MSSLTRDFRETIRERVERSVKFREALIAEAEACYRDGDKETAAIIERDLLGLTYRSATMGVAPDAESNQSE